MTLEAVDDEVVPDAEWPLELADDDVCPEEPPEAAVDAGALEDAIVPDEEFANDEESKPSDDELDSAPASRGPRRQTPQASPSERSQKDRRSQSPS